MRITKRKTPRPNNDALQVRTIWAYVYHHYLDDYDWFYICDDDVYMVVDNLRTYLDGPEIHAQEEGQLDVIARNKNRNIPKHKRTDTMRPRPLYLGTPMMFNTLAFAAGGAGYTLNRAALKRFGDEELTTYQTKSRDSREDVFMGSALARQSVFISDSRDPHNAVRFGWSMGQHVRFRIRTSI